jgi:hypothetical protein
MINKRPMGLDNVYHYCRAILGRWPPVETLRELPINTQLGKRCVAVIDAALPLFELARKAQRQQERHLQDEVVRITFSIITATINASWKR